MRMMESIRHQMNEALWGPLLSEVSSTCTCVLAPQPYFHKPSHAARRLPHRSEETSVSLRLLERDKSLTFCKWPSGSPYWTFLGWLTGRRHPLPVHSDISEYASKHQTVSKSGSCWQWNTVASCCYLIICAAWRGQRWIFWLRHWENLLRSPRPREEYDKIGCKLYFIILYFASHRFERCKTLRMSSLFIPPKAHHTLKIYWVMFLE